jgi:glycyl-tRNA synthetase beta chain
VFQKQLGSVYEKCDRLAALARFIAEESGSNPAWAERAANLSKCDLLTLMVQEFPKLQGLMGRYYADHDQEPGEVAQALEEQYRPRFAGDQLPQTATGQALALADRLDTLIGAFAIGQAPSGAKDPFALRRAALGVLRILIEGHLALDLEALLERAARCFNTRINAQAVIEPVFAFIMERLRAYYLERGFRPDTFEAVLDCRPTRPLDFHRRLQAVSEFRTLPEAESLAAANKRIRNILRQLEGTLPFRVRTELLTEDAERALAGCLAELSSEVIPLLEAGMYSEALTRLATLREPVDLFFDQVMVMTENKELRDNRIALLNDLESLFLGVANFSQLQG